MIAGTGTGTGTGDGTGTGSGTGDGTGTGTGNGTTIVVQDCNGTSAQSYTAMPMSASGVYAFKNVASQRCLNVQGPSTSNGALMQLYDCGSTPGSNAQFSVQ